MLNLLAQISPRATDPSSWSEAIARNGFGIVVASVLVGCFVIGGGFIIWRLFGANGWGERVFTRLDAFLVSQEKISIDNFAILKTQSEFCRHIHGVNGLANNTDIRTAGHAFAEIGRKIGEKVGAEVEQHVDRIHAVLRGELVE